MKILQAITLADLGGAQSVLINLSECLINDGHEVIVVSELEGPMWDILPDKITDIMSFFDRGCELIFYNNTVIDNDYNIILESYFSHTCPRHSFMQSINYKTSFFREYLWLFQKTIKNLSHSFLNNPIRYDHWIAYNAIYHQKHIIYIEKPLMLYRRHGNNVSPSAEKSKNSLWFKISYRFCSIIAYILIVFR
jgi:hypothetical protein